MILCYLLLLIISAPFIIFFCSKWGAFGWFRGKELSENKKIRTKPDTRTMNDI